MKSSIFVHIRQLIQVLAQWLCCSPDMHFTSAYPFVLFHHRIEICHHDQFYSPIFCSAPFKQILSDSTWPHIHDIIIQAYPSHKVWISLLKAFNLLLWVSPLDSWDWQKWLRSSWDTLEIQGGTHVVWPNLSKPILLRFDRFDDKIQEHAESMC